jgi:hypothetical protein
VLPFKAKRGSHYFPETLSWEHNLRVAKPWKCRLRLHDWVSGRTRKPTRSTRCVCAVTLTERSEAGYQAQVIAATFMPRPFEPVPRNSYGSARRLWSWQAVHLQRRGARALRRQHTRKPQASPSASLRLRQQFRITSTRNGYSSRRGSTTFPTRAAKLKDSRVDAP